MFDQRNRACYENAMGVQQRIPTYFCPSDTAQESSVGTPTGYMTASGASPPFAGGSRGNYAVCVGSGFITSPVAPANPWPSSPTALGSVAYPTNGAFQIADGGSTKGRKLDKITDGTSTTVALSEVLAAPAGTADVRGTWMLVTGGSYTHFLTPNQRNGDEVPGCVNIEGIDQTCGTAPGSDFQTRIGARSRHSGGVNVLFLDGHTQFITDDVNPGTWAALSTHAGKEPLGDY
jgi:prepilin-type processing-associated H-X9-DG protein